MKSLFLFGLLLSTAAHASAARDIFSPQLTCTLQVGDDGLPAIPQYNFVIGRNGRGALVLKESVLRPAGVKPSYELLMLTKTTGNVREYKTARVPSIEITDGANSRSAILTTDTRLEYYCVSPKEICASGHYDAQTDSCVFPNSIVK